MGGYGSTRWSWHTKKDVVEDCRILSIFDLKRESILEQGVWRSGSWFWYNAYTKERTATIWYELNTRSHTPTFRVEYTITRWDKSKRDYDYPIRLEMTPCRFGGIRWWFICPLTVGGRPCKRRVAKLYLPPGSGYFGCRHCHNLTYRKSQESDKRINALRKLGPMAILAGMKSGDVDLLDALKALPDEIWSNR